MTTAIELLSHPVFDTALIEIDIDYGVETPDASIGINGGLYIEHFEVIKINNKEYSTKILNAMTTFIKNRMNVYDDIITDSIEHDLEADYDY